MFIKPFSSRKADIPLFTFWKYLLVYSLDLLDLFYVTLCLIIGNFFNRDSTKQRQRTLFSTKALVSPHFFLLQFWPQPLFFRSSSLFYLSLLLRIPNYPPPSPLPYSLFHPLSHPLLDLEVYKFGFGSSLQLK